MCRNSRTTRSIRLSSLEIFSGVTLFSWAMSSDILLWLVGWVYEMLSGFHRDDYTKSMVTCSGRLRNLLRPGLKIGHN